MQRRARPLPPLDTAALERLALRYVERFATTRGKLVDYLKRKMRERGWEGEAADPDTLAERLAALGYIDDRAWAAARAASLGRRGLGEQRITQALWVGRVSEEDTASVVPVVRRDAIDSALRFARRKRIGPFAVAEADRSLRDKQLAAMMRAGHTFDLSRTIVQAKPGEEQQFDAVQDQVHCDDGEPC